MVDKKHGKTISQGEQDVLAQKIRELDAARESKNLDQMELLGKQISALKSSISRKKELFDRNLKLANINKRNKATNIATDLESGRRKKDEAKTKGDDSHNADVDPFARRETRPKILWNTGSGKKKQTNAASSPLAQASQNTPRSAEKAFPLEALHGSDTIEAARLRLAQRLGVDPWKEAQLDKRTRYLSRVCKGIPPVNSVERAAMRQGCSLEQWIAASGSNDDSAMNM